MMKHTSTALLFAVFAVTSCTGAQGGKKSLYIGALFGLSDHWFELYSKAFVEIFKRAFEEINNNSIILQDYELNLVVKDTKMIAGQAAEKLAELVYEKPTKIAVIGPLFSGEVALVGEITPFYNLIQMSFVAGTSSVTDRQIYKSLYSCNFIQDDLNYLRIALMKYFKWSRVATIIFNDDYHKTQIDEFHQMLVKDNFTLVTSAIVTDMKLVKEHIRRLKQYGARIIFGAFRSTKAPFIFCEAYKQEFYGHKYVWILTGGSVHHHWPDTMDASETSCTREEILIAANGYLTLSTKYLSEENVTTFTGRTPEEYNDYIKAYLEPFDYPLSRTHPYAYDAAYALALGLNNSLRYIDNTELTEFNYTNTYLFDVIRRGMDAVDFYGVSGPLSFRNGRRVGFSYIEHNIDFIRTSVGKFNPNTGHLIWSKNPQALWSGKPVPKDYFVHRKEFPERSMVAIGMVLTFNGIGMVISVMFLVFNIVFSENKHIKMSSPRINNLIIVGTMIMYGSVCFSSYEYSRVEHLNDHTCMVNVWIYAIGFTVVFGALFSKTWRVHVLFRQLDLRKKTIRDVQLFGIVGILISLDILILMCWTIIHPLKNKYIEIAKQISDGDIIFTELYSQCYHPKYVYWLAVEYVYKGFLLAFGTFLAWETRKVRVPALNDSKLIGFCVYNIVLMCSLGVPIHYALTVEQLLVKYILTNTLTIFCTTLVLCILFIPKLSLRNSTGNVNFVKSFDTKRTNITDLPCVGSTKEEEKASVKAITTVQSLKPPSTDKLLNPEKLARPLYGIDNQLMLGNKDGDNVNKSSNNENTTSSGEEVSTISMPPEQITLPVPQPSDC